MLSGATAAGIVPLSMAWIGDNIPYERRQATLARYLTGTILGMGAGQLIGGVNFTGLKLTIGSPIADRDPVTINYGAFIQNIVDFLIVAWAIFMVVKVINSMKRKQEAAPAAPPAPTKDQILLTEIRDLLKRRA